LHRDIASAAYALFKVKYECGNRFYFDPTSNDWVGPFKQFEFWQPKPMLVIEPEELPQLAEEMQSLGFTPSDLSVKAGELTATKAHLEDMRKIAFMALEEPARG
jgi:hypothetical protein